MSAIRCPFCVSSVALASLIARLRVALGGKLTCRRCGRSFSRRTGRHVANIYDCILEDFERRLADELKGLPVADRAEVLVQFNLHMENAKVASVHILLRSLAETLHPHVASLARGYEGRLDVRRVDRGGCACVDVDAHVEEGTLSRRRFRIARIEPSGFIEVDLDHSAEPVHRGQIAR